MSIKPTLFIGSSSEGLQVAESIQLLLNDDADVTVWKQGVFKLSKGYIESLCEALEKFDFALLILTPDDVTRSRKQQESAPRDNVVFELGLFTGKLGRDRCYFVFESDSDLKLPSDLLGVSAATYRMHESGNLLAALGATCTQIRQRIRELGPLTRPNPDTVRAHEHLNTFCENATGYWWSFRHTDISTLGFVTITPEAATNTLKMSGNNYDANGSLESHWESMASCINLSAQRLYYYWTGWHSARPAEPYEGIGELSFQESTGHFETAIGVFSDTNLTDIRSTTKKSSTLKRCIVQDVKEMLAGDTDRIAAVIRKRLKAKTA
jgi:hypothetical protein